MTTVPATASGTAPRSPLAGALRLADYWVTVLRRTWRGSVVTSFVTPFLYVLAMGVLLGGFVHVGASRLDGAPSYLSFIAPGMVAMQAMTTAFGEATYPVMGAVKWDRTYFSMHATPLGIVDIVTAHLAFALFRIAVTCGVFIAVLAPFGVFHSVWGTLVAFPVQILVGIAFAAPVYGLSAGLKSENAFSLLFRLGLIPLSLFSGVYFPITNLPHWLFLVARWTPLWQGADLTRMLVLGNLHGWWPLVHVVYLLAMAGAGYVWSVRRLGRTMTR